MKLKKLVSLLPVIALLSACGQPDIKLSEQQAEHGASPDVTAPMQDVVVYPDDRPSVPDGKVVWAKAQCAQCHGENGTGGSAKVAIGDKQWSRFHKPIDTYLLLMYGKPDTNHKAYRENFISHDLWNLTVYVHSLGVPVLNDDEIAAIDPVFGSNCAVCHGTKGDGDGPLMRNLEPMPANFQKFDRFFNRTDAVLFDHIANGIKWEGMPNFLGKEDKAKNVKFDEEYIHKLVAYVRKYQVSNAPTIVASASPSNLAEPKPAATKGGAAGGTRTGAGAQGSDLPGTNTSSNQPASPPDGGAAH